MRNFISIDVEFVLRHGLDKSEMLLFPYLYSVPSWATTLVAPGGEVWYNISRRKLIEDMSIVSDKVDTMYRVVKRLEEKGLIRLNRSFGQDWIQLTEDGKQYQCSQQIGKKSNDSDDAPKNSDDAPKNSDDAPKTPYSNSKIIESNSCAKNDFILKTVWSKLEKDHVRKHVLKVLRKQDLPGKPFMYVNEVMEWLFDQGHQVKVTAYPNDYGIEKMVKIWVESRIPEGAEEIPVGHLVAIKQLQLTDRDRIKYLRRHLSRDHLFCAWLAIGATGTDLQTFDRQIEDKENKFQWTRYQKIYTEGYIVKKYLSG
jgi:hypothetical protein